MMMNWNMNDDIKKMAQQGLSLLSAVAIKRGMRAFSHCPNGSDKGCFISSLTNSGSFHAGAILIESRSQDSCRLVGSLSIAYEQDDNSWLYGECVRELAERGVTIEPLPAVVEAV